MLRHSMFSKGQQMSLRHAWYILPLAAAAVALLALLLWRGKGEGDGAVSEEAALEEYYAGLENIRRERLPIAAERAKALIMKRRGVTEPEAHKALQQYAMNHGMKMAEYAAQIIKLSKGTD